MSKGAVRPTPRPLTAEWLRKQAGEGVCFMGDAKDALMLADALEIADESAESFITCECHSVTADGFEWSDLDDGSDCDLSAEAQERIRESLAQSERHLESRGLLIRHPERLRLVRFRDVPA